MSEAERRLWACEQRLETALRLLADLKEQLRQQEQQILELRQNAG